MLDLFYFRHLHEISVSPMFRKCIHYNKCIMFLIIQAIRSHFAFSHLFDKNQDKIQSEKRNLENKNSDKVFVSEKKWNNVFVKGFFVTKTFFFVHIVFFFRNFISEKNIFRQFLFIF